MLKSAEMEAVLRGHAEDYATRLGAGWQADTKQMQTRVIASAYTTSSEAARAAMADNAGLKTLGIKSPVSKIGGHQVKEHIRHLKDGRTIIVRAHTRGGH